jgi:cytochrome c-type biogenesis protein
MRASLRVGITLAVVIVAAAIAMHRRMEKRSAIPPLGSALPALASDNGLPTFVEIGAKSCIPCVMMTEVMDELRVNYPGKLNVVFLDLEMDDSHAERFGVKIIPTQLLLSPDGGELFRHEGFFPAAEIVAQWKALGHDLGLSAGARSSGTLGTLFGKLSSAVEGAAGLALAAAFVWGVLSILLSPCHLASIPLIVGFIDHQGKATPRRSFLLAALFSAGILITIALIGMVTAGLGRMAGDLGVWGNYLVALIFLGVGLYLAGVLRIQFPGVSQVNMTRRGLLAAFILGLVFGIALGPCTFAWMAPVLGVVFTVGSEIWLYAAALLMAYGVGHCSVIVLAGTFTGCVQRFISWGSRSGGTEQLKRACGVFVVAGGYWLIWTA